MGKKRKSETTRLDEVDRSMYTTFCSAANSLSQLYSQASNHQRLSFQAGERHALDKLYQWILRQEEGGSRVATVDIVTYLQNELEYAADEPPMSPRLPNQYQQSQTAHLNNTGLAVSSNLYPTATIGQGVRSGLSDQHLSSPVRRSLQHYHLSQSSSILNIISSGNTTRNNETNSINHQHREVNSPSSNDSMDIHADSPSHDFPY